MMVSGLHKQNTSSGLLPDTGLLFSAPGIQDSVTLRSFSSDNSRERGEPGLSEERPTHQCLSEARERQTSVSGDRNRLTLYRDGAGGADRVQFSADLTAVDSRVLHPNGSDLQRAVGVFSVSATIQITNYKLQLQENAALMTSSALKLSPCVMFMFSWDCFADIG